MISTSSCCTSDYYSSSDIEYDYDDVVKAAPQHLSSIKETNIILQTLLQYHHSPSYISSSIKFQQSIRLFKLVQENHLSNEIFIRANAILHKLLHSICTNEINESILIACLSLATKLNEHSTYSNITLFNNNILIANENLICNTLDWDIDIITPINYVEAILLHVSDYLIKDRLRPLTYELIVLCLTDIRCMDLSVLSMAIGCLLMAYEMINCCELIPKQVFEYEQENNKILFQTSLIYIRQVLMNILHR
ncbi:unnamed protein product [Rotaria sordida]|uniref:Cyclin N-terminal domain-containing protein n=1 Tax=Rotaria sordida TaxID=392033 RepID=A0A813UTL0_9BILA|nr:unnamed protein product [Rotaria sordida]